MVARILRPYSKKINGSGNIPSEINARSEVPHPIPNESYILLPAKGNKAPRRDLKTVPAAIAEAACTVYASMRYIELASCRQLVAAGQNQVDDKYLHMQ